MEEDMPETTENTQSVFIYTYHYTNNIINMLVEDYQKVLDDEQKGCNIMHRRVVTPEHQTAHIFTRSDTGEKLFGILYNEPYKPILLL